MREIKPESFTVYTLDELSPSAREKAISAIAEKLGGAWWDSADIDDISDMIRYTLANAFGVPGHDNYGEADFPGIPGVELDGWDLDRGGSVALRGTLTRENAPRLPWADGIVEVRLTTVRSGNYTSVDIETDEDELDPANELDLTVARERCGELADAMEEAIENAMHAALKSGREEMEYRTSVEYAEQEILANEREFLADGTPYFG